MREEGGREGGREEDDNEEGGKWKSAGGTAILTCR